MEKRPRSDRDPEITFGSGSEVYLDHDDALVISTQVANARVKRIMADTGSLADILYFDAFRKLGLTDKDLFPMTSMLTGFTGDSVSPAGMTTLPVTIGEEPRSKTLMVSVSEIIQLERDHDGFPARRRGDQPRTTPTQDSDDGSSAVKRQREREGDNETHNIVVGDYDAW
ncbi:hypothetical protein B296_00046527 [Ensete ventricosum]|uniref:Uncharacterized protein n=1 Tax=Ensete ventricosum TaxID=4639 RepID=A0A426XBA4_ENSVE|nr:hypothetical protein B296_00046527 [Ensete ventricosum]